MTLAVTALILAGGRATRLGGVDKTALVIDGETIFARQLRVLAPRVAEVLVSVGPEQSAAKTRGGLAAHSPRTVTDRVAGVGPLAGVHAGLAACATPWMLVVAGDMPHLTGELVDRMVAAASEAVDAVGIRIDGLPEPLFCLLRTAPALAALERRFAEGKRKASELLTAAGLRVAWLEGVDRALLTNINTPDDLR